MLDDIKIQLNKEHLDDLIKKVNDKLDEIRARYIYLSNEMNHMTWNGVAANRCIEMHGVVGIYQEEIFGEIEEFINVVNRFYTSIETFCTESDLINSIKLIQ